MSGLETPALAEAAGMVRTHHEILQYSATSFGSTLIVLSNLLLHAGTAAGGPGR